jgi:hypothetical protein
MSPPEQTQEKLPGVLMHFPPLHGFEASLHSSMSLQRFPSISNMYPDEQAQEKDPGLMTLNNNYQQVSVTVKR